VDIAENVPLAPLTTLRVGGPARYFARARSEQEIVTSVTWARETSLPLFVLGGGSNLLVSDSGFPGLVLQIAVKGIAQRNEGGTEIFEVAAGEDWDDFVAATVEAKCGGIECLSGIPGSVGGTPVQNVGAYGQEVKETIRSARALEIVTGKILDFSNHDCQFSYRKSIFNTSPGRYIVLQVRFELRKETKPKLEYADLKRYFAGRTSPSLSEVRNAVREIRRSKGMLIVEGDPDCRSAGSFFKNPVVEANQYEALCALPAAAGKNVPRFAAGEQWKLSAAWLVEHSGFPRGYVDGAVGISSKHTLAIVNRGGARAADVLRLKNEIQKRVQQEFGIALQPEPVMLGFDSQP